MFTPSEDSELLTEHEIKLNSAIKRSTLQPNFAGIAIDFFDKFYYSQIKILFKFIMYNTLASPFLSINLENLSIVL